MGKCLADSHSDKVISKTENYKTVFSSKVCDLENVLLFILIKTSKCVNYKAHY